uniref:Uncharacterized protein n=1 Tax=Wuchereria bancrofti TaxID=6293 RepID=A0AAF5Q5K5_WUCBA
MSALTVKMSALTMQWWPRQVLLILEEKTRKKLGRKELKKLQIKAEYEREIKEMAQLKIKKKKKQLKKGFFHAFYALGLTFLRMLFNQAKPAGQRIQLENAVDIKLKDEFCFTKLKAELIIAFEDITISLAQTEIEVDKTSAVDAVVKSDKHRLALMEEETQLIRKLEEGDISVGEHLKEVVV